MGRRPRYVNVVPHVRATRPDIADPAAAILARRLVVDGRIMTSPRTLVPASASVVLRPSPRLRGEGKLTAALDAFGIEVDGRSCLDVGAAAGGFTRVLLQRGAATVIALDAGHGQLRGYLRADPRVVNLERTNLSELAGVVPQRSSIGVVTVDLSYLSLASAVPQLEGIRLSPAADLVALVKPMFELGLAAPPTDLGLVRRTADLARRGIERDRRWSVKGDIPSPVLGARGAREWLLHARRRQPLTRS